MIASDGGTPEVEEVRGLAPAWRQQHHNKSRDAHGQHRGEQHCWSRLAWRCVSTHCRVSSDTAQQPSPLSSASSIGRLTAYGGFWEACGSSGCDGEHGPDKELDERQPPAGTHDASEPQPRTHKGAAKASVWASKETARVAKGRARVAKQAARHGRPQVRVGANGEIVLADLDEAEAAAPAAAAPAAAVAPAAAAFDCSAFDCSAFFEKVAPAAQQPGALRKRGSSAALGL
ncbi:hypothetical protein FOA52_011093 [Chlamydomonas sp. UWO 241]|nr:hypothetical protein FOA52_011093 [Chlamydomonas sp. UWO 241]